MKNNTHLNYLALNQNILGKVLIMGSGPEEGNEVDPIITYEGLKIYLNGKHNLLDIIPSDLELDETISFGDILHPYAMGDNASGKIRYELGISENLYLIIVRLKLDENTCGPSDEASDILALIMKKDIPETYDYGSDNNYFLAKEMLLSHFDYLFKFYNSYDELINGGWEISEELAIVEIVKYYFDSKKPAGDKNNAL